MWVRPHIKPQQILRVREWSCGHRAGRSGQMDKVAETYTRSCSWSLSHVWLSDTMDCSPPGSSVQGISQARILKRIAISSSRGLSDPGIELMSPASPALIGGFLTTEPPGKLIYKAHIPTWEATTYKIDSQWEMLYDLGSSNQCSMTT